MPFPRAATTDITLTRAATVSPSDTTDLARPAKALYIGTSTNNTQAVSVITTGGDTITFPNVQQGSVLNLGIARVRATGTTATNLIALS